jgi:hypothetical protein
VKEEEKIEFYSGTIDFSNLQIIKLYLNDVELNEKNIKELFDVQDLVFARASKMFVLIMDASKLKKASMRAQLEFAQRYKGLEKKHIGQFMKNYIIVSNPLMKIAMHGIQKISKPTVKQVICSSMDQAEDRARLEISSW